MKGVQPLATNVLMNKSCLVLSGLGAVVLVALLAIGLTLPLQGHSANGAAPTFTQLPAPPPPDDAGDSYLERQARALQPAFRADLAALSQAPRYTLSASVDPKAGKLIGQMRVQYTNTTAQALSELVFRLLPNARTIYGGGNLTIVQATRGETALQIEPARDGTSLRLPLTQPLEPGQTISVDLSFKAQAPAGSGQGYGIFSRTQGSISLAGWYPVLAVYDGGWQTPPVPSVGDAMWAEMSLYEVTLTVPSGYELVSTGTAVNQQEEEGQTTWHIVSGPAREFAVAISDRFEKRETQAGDVMLRLYTLPARSPATSPDEALKMMSQAFQAYVARFGPYPYTEFDLVEAAVGIGGYEFSGMVYVDYARRAQGPFAQYRYLTVHEIAHQWWYNLVGNPTVAEPWLDEAFASYAAVLYLEHAGGAQAAAQLLGAWRAEYGLRDPGDPPVNSPALDFGNWVTYRSATYYHGALFLEQLRREIGDAKFFALLQRLQTDYRYRMITTGDVLSLAEEAAGRDLDALFEKWFKLR